ncbi:dynein intermediate chain 2, axonemal isoform X3 [Monomorium pharaonis]|uniref:dynein intermediate chain 2, axonemal isoform X3 n=1 Tax=Monomorium pharaonis TaxID=307658 RepID=UPI00063FB7CB|nr:dynein intermediate chain 2, axonemal isoform X3 [Monomorium pharaonis]
MEYTYTKKRMHFGKRCNFSDSDKIEVEIKSNPALMNNYVRMDPVTHATQCSKVYAVHEVNTTTATYKDNKMFHYEGGWPKDINMKDLEQTVRYRRKIEKDELYIHTMLQLLPSIEHCILQNNACNVYEHYFADMETIPLRQRASSRTVNVYRDPLTLKRQITHLSWSPDQGNRFAASYCNADYKNISSGNYTSYIWEVVGGLTTGQVACWDIRRGPETVDTSSVEFSHRDPCDKTLWINSKTGTEFFSASKDGQIKWWDTRKMLIPTETLVIDLVKPENQNVDKATGISALQFEPSMGTRFMCGLENGVVISGNRKGKTPGEKIATRFRAQYGPVISLERNPTFVKNFLTVGDWTSRIWSEDCRESCIAWTPGHRDFLTGGAWSATRYSVYFLIKVDGTLDVWDFLIQQDSPVLSIKVCDESLTCLRAHEQGQLAAVANKKGSTYLLEFSEALTINQKNDKLLLTALLDRETRREKVIEAKNREQRLKMKTLKMHDESDLTDAFPKLDEREDSKEFSSGLRNALIVQCEQEYENIINVELTRQAETDAIELNNNVMLNNAIIN